jgi:type II secretory pathway component PulC
MLSIISSMVYPVHRKGAWVAAFAAVLLVSCSREPVESPPPPSVEATPQIVRPAEQAVTPSHADALLKLDLKVSGIVYSAGAAKSSALLSTNGADPHLVKVGDSVADGVRVVLIGPESVTIESGGAHRTISAGAGTFARVAAPSQTRPHPAVTPAPDGDIDQAIRNALQAQRTLPQ